MGGYRGNPQGHRWGARGDHDDHAQLDRATTSGLYLFGQGGPLQNTEQVFSPTSNAVAEAAQAPRLLG